MSCVLLNGARDFKVFLICEIELVFRYLSLCYINDFGLDDPSSYRFIWEIAWKGTKTTQATLFFCFPIFQGACITRCITQRALGTVCMDQSKVPGHSGFTLFSWPPYYRCTSSYSHAAQKTLNLQLYCNISFMEVRVSDSVVVIDMPTICLEKMTYLCGPHSNLGTPINVAIGLSQRHFTRATFSDLD